MTDLIKAADLASQKLAKIVDHPYSKGNFVFYDCGLATISADDIRELLSEYKALTAYRSARESAGEVKVRKLVWDDFEGGCGAKASIIGPFNYIIQYWRGRGEFELSYSAPGYGICLEGERFHKTIEAAKEAAQSDYTRSALTE
ncbi:MAG: hypothetical protein Unbinned7865contig1001_25 [Prokaryotic dsDNA virus sp.]|nr:MAG: hypothetical protein Unbinned7865contig1001_25 [Prokaryotic dsDNA virus sp.]|tara:strand:- start:2432 stop:2863 length:432 start_codon:yes stop_codon:yes gene_type:complete